MGHRGAGLFEGSDVWLGILCMVVWTRGLWQAWGRRPAWQRGTCERQAMGCMSSPWHGSGGHRAPLLGMLAYRGPCA